MSGGGLAARQCDEQAAKSAASSGKWQYTVERRTPARSATALIEVRAGPSSSCNATALSVIRLRVASSSTARRVIRYGRFWSDMTVVRTILDTARCLPLYSRNTTVQPIGVNDMTAMQTGVKVVGPGDGAMGFLGSIGVRFMIDGSEAAERFSLVEHPMSPWALAAPVHRHTREDEYSFVLEGRMGALLGDDVVEAGPGDLVHKPRDQWHTFWNAGDEPCRILEIISPAGFERFFAELVDLGGVAQAGPDTLAELCARYALEMQPDSVPELIERFGVRMPGDPIV